MNMEPLMGFEPTTCSLRVSCSTAELKRRKTVQIYLKYVQNKKMVIQILKKGHDQADAL